MQVGAGARWLRRGRPAALILLIAVIFMTGAGERSDTVPDLQLVQCRNRLLEHPLFRLRWDASHADSLAALRYDNYFPVDHFGIEGPACLALIHILAVEPIDTVLVAEPAGVSSSWREDLLRGGSLLSIEVLAVFGCRMKDTPRGPRQVVTMFATSLHDHRIHGGRGEMNQVLYPGAEAFVMLTESPASGGLEFLVNLLCLGEPDHRAPRELSDAELEDPFFGLRYRVTPLFREFGRALRASAPDSAATQSESSIPSGQ